MVDYAQFYFSLIPGCRVGSSGLGKFLEILGWILEKVKRRERESSVGMWFNKVDSSAMPFLPSELTSSVWRSVLILRGRHTPPGGWGPDQIEMVAAWSHHHQNNVEVKLPSAQLWLTELPRRSASIVMVATQSCSHDGLSLQGTFHFIRNLQCCWDWWLNNFPLWGQKFVIRVHEPFILVANLAHFSDSAWLFLAGWEETNFQPKWHGSRDSTYDCFVGLISPGQNGKGSAIHEVRSRGSCYPG